MITPKAGKYPCPSGEVIWARYYNANNTLTHIITSKANSRETYFLYAVADSKLKKVGKASSPPELEAKFFSPKSEM